MFTLAHLSDVHLGPLPSVSYRDLISKRITGYINWHRTRRDSFHDGVVGALRRRHGGQFARPCRADWRPRQPGARQEIAGARNWLEDLPFGPIMCR